MTGLWITIRAFLSLNTRRKRLNSGWSSAAIFFFRGWTGSLFWTIALPQRMWKAALASWSLVAFQPAMQEQHLGSDTADHQHRKNIPRKRSHHRFFILRRTKPWKTSLRTMLASFVRKSTRNRWQSWKRKKFTYLVFALRYPFRIKIFSQYIQHVWTGGAQRNHADAEGHSRQLETVPFQNNAKGWLCLFRQVNKRGARRPTFSWTGETPLGQSGGECLQTIWGPCGQQDHRNADTELCDTCQQGDWYGRQSGWRGSSAKGPARRFCY